MEKLYTLNEIFYSLQGEGYHSGRPTVFVRFAGCNLSCNFCDEDYTPQFKASAKRIAEMVESLWPNRSNRYVVFTGGEPAMQLDSDIISEVGKMGFFTGIETNGTLPLPRNLDWVTVSPKTHDLVVSGDELKLLHPYLAPDGFAKKSFTHFYLQPISGIEGSMEKTIEYCLQEPQWKLSVQLHKLVGIS